MIDGRRMLKLRTAKTRAELLRGIMKLKGSGLWVEEDTTEREEMVEDWLWKKRAQLERAGCKVPTKKWHSKRPSNFSDTSRISKVAG